MAENIKFILASASPRRRQLLLEILSDFEVIPAVGEERADKALPPEKLVCALAENKCAEVFEKYPESVVIGCDTVVVYGGKILGKPKSAEQAKQTLEMLSGNTHSVLTGVCVRSHNKKITEYCRTQVKFNLLSDEGSYTNVVGLPVELVGRMIKEVLEDEQTCSGRRVLDN